LPVFVKAQVPLGDRAAQGLIVECRTLEQTQRTAKKLLGLRIGRYVVDSLLIEAAVPSQDLLYAAVTTDPKERRHILIVSGGGGTNVETRARPAYFNLPALHVVPPWIGIRAAKELGYHGETAADLGRVLSGLVRAYFDLEAVLVEVNPLALSPDGWVALDARIELDDDALYRHPDLPRGKEWRKSALEAQAEAVDRLDQRGVAGRLVEFDGELGLIIGGGGASLTIFDAVLEAGLRPANYCEIGGNPTVRKVSELTRLILSKPGVRYLAVIMNVVSNTRSDLIARGVIKGVLRAGRDPADTLVAFRVPGSWEDEARLLLARYGVQILGREISLDDVVHIVKERIRQHADSG
jgi:succinyl-CoA synthetase beta subunit/citryl-CoA synthetase large subunit